MAQFIASAWSASTVNSVGFEAAKAGDGYAWLTRWASTSTGAPQWLQRDEGVAKVAQAYHIVPGDFNANQDPASWTLLGSNDPTFATSTILDTRSGVTFGGAAKSYTFTNSTAFRYYRLNVTAINGSTVLSISEFALGEGAMSWMDGHPLFAAVIGGSITLGRDFVPAVDGYITHLSWPARSGGTGTVNLRLYGPTGTLLASTTDTQTGKPDNVRVDAPLAAPYAVTAGTKYRVAAWIPNASWYSPGAISSAVVSGDLTSSANGAWYGTTDAYPTTVGGVRYAVGVRFERPVAAPSTDVTGTLAATLPALAPLTASIAGTVTAPPPVTGTIDLTLPPLPALTMSATGTATAPGATNGTVELTLPPLAPLTAAITGDVTDPAPVDVTGTLTLTLPPLMPLAMSITDSDAPPAAAPWTADDSGLAIVGIVPPVGIFHVDYPAAPIPATVDPVALTRVSHQIPSGLITVNAQGEPVPVDEVDYPIVRQIVGHLHVWASGQDVTFLQDKAARIGSYSAALPFGERAAQLDFPQIMLLAEQPDALAPDRPVDIAVVKLDGSRINLWSGHISSRAGGNAEKDVRVNRQCEGPVYAADHQRHPVPLIMAPTDRGRVVVDELNGTGSRTFGTIAPAVTGKTTSERGSSSDTRLDYAQNQLAQLWTPDADQWTVARTGTPRAYRMALKSTVGRTWTLTYGAPGVQVDLTRDETQRYNVIWGHGSATDANGYNYAWQNMHFPGLLPYDPPDYPFTDTSNELELGTTDADTDSGDGVTVWQTRMVEIGFPLTIDGVINAADKDAASRLQRLRGILDNGEIGPQTWNATWDVGTTGAALERVRLPLAYDPRVWPTLHAANGKVIGPNPVYDRTIQRYESDDIEFPPGTTKAQAIVSAQEDLARNLDPGLTGTIVATSCPWEGWRGEVREGDRVNLLGYEGATVALTVAELDVAPDDGFKVTLRVDTKARDAMTLASIEARDRDSAADLARKPGRLDRISQIDRNRTSPFEGESPAGKLPKIAINGDAGLWTVWPVFVSEVGTMAFIDLQTSGPACDFSVGISGWPITANQCAQYVGNPLADADAWEQNVDLLRSRFGFINSWGNASEPAGKAGPGLTRGRLFDDSPLSFASQKAGWLYVWIFAAQSCSISGRIYPASLQ